MPDATFQLTLDHQPVEPSIVGLVQRLEIRESDSEPTLAALRFRLAQKENGEFAPLDDGLFQPASELGITVAAPGGLPTHLFQGFVTHLRPHFEEIESNCYVEVLAMDAAVVLDAEERAASYPDATDADAAQQICQRYGIELDGEQTAARHEERRQLLVQRGTDWDFLRMLARRNGFVCYFEPDETGRTRAHFKKRALKDPPQADVSLLREDAALRWVDLQWVATGPARYQAQTIDPLQKQIVRAEGDRDLDPMGDGFAQDQAETGWRRAKAESTTALMRDPPPLETALRAQATAETDRALFAVEARGELDPSRYRGLLRARRPVLLKGVGRAMAGAYWVKAVRTTLEEGALTQTFVAERNAVGLSGREDFGQQAEEVPAE